MITSTTATDNCATSFIFAQSPTNATIVSTPGSYNILFTATDPSGNKGTKSAIFSKYVGNCTATVKFVDVTAPIVQCTSQQIVLDATCKGRDN